MQVIRPAGRDAAAKKYDLLSALMAHALAHDKHRQRSVLRLMALITTRYNWQRDELAVGQREIARLWCVDERTVKREMARLRDLGWLVTKRAGARGRVTVHGLGIERIMLDTTAEWPHIGPDYVARMGAAPAEPAPDRTVVPFARPPARAAGPVWAAMSERLAGEDAPGFAAWFAGLRDEGISGGVLTLAAPSAFHASYVQTHLAERLRIAARRVDPAIAAVRVVAP